MHLLARIGDSGHPIGPLEGASEGEGVGMVGHRSVAHPIAQPV
jgi:hypothetical protein